MDTVTARSPESEDPDHAGHAAGHLLALVHAQDATFPTGPDMQAAAVALIEALASALSAARS